MSEEETVGSISHPEPSVKQKVALGSALASVALSTAAALTGNADNVVDVADATLSAVTNPIEAILPDISSERTTPNEVLDGTADVKFDGKLTAYLSPNAGGKTIDMRKIDLISTNINPKDGKPFEDKLDLSHAMGFRIENPLFVSAQNLEGGRATARWIKLSGSRENGERIDVYLPVSENLTLNGNILQVKPIGNQNGMEAYLPKNQGDILPNGFLSHVVPLPTPIKP